MNNVFLVFGYGVPKNILKDEHYNFYLTITFNTIYNFVTKNKINKPIIIACGGKTDVIKPYKRTEANEIIRWFSTFITKRPYVKSVTKEWLFIKENKSLSTLENLLNSNTIIQKKKVKQVNVFIFCEQTRARRINVLAKKIFNNKSTIKIVPVDFDGSANRYLPTEYLAKKESAELKHSLWALESTANLKKHHKVFAEKFKYLREIGHKQHVNAVKKWWDQKLKQLK